MAKYTFLKQKTATGAKLSLGLGLASAAVIPVLILLAVFGVGDGSNVLGGIGFMAFLLAVYAFYLGLRSLAARSHRIYLSAVATILSGVVLIGWIILFILGAS